MNMKHYWYPYFQKDMMEKHVQEIFECGFICCSTSPYSSPVLLVKKKDATWRFCVDSRAINALTVKDRFPIPTIDKLLDELDRAIVFSTRKVRSDFIWFV